MVVSVSWRSSGSFISRNSTMMSLQRIHWRAFISLSRRWQAILSSSLTTQLFQRLWFASTNSDSRSVLIVNYWRRWLSSSLHLHLTWQKSCGSSWVVRQRVSSMLNGQHGTSLISLRMRCSWLYLSMVRHVSRWLSLLMQRRKILRRRL